MAIIPARGGSKRIPRKNIREFAGKPIIAHSIECADRSKLFDRIIVSTDDKEISAVAHSFGAEAPFERPAALSDDYTGTTEVIAHAVDWLEDRGVSLSAVCCIYATAPFIDPEDLRRAHVILQSEKWQYVFAATTFGSPIYRSFRRDAQDGLEMLFPESFTTRSQDFDEVLHDAAQFYWGLPQAWLAKTKIFDKTSTVLPIPRWRVQDIDTEEDWRRAESIASYLGICSH